MKHPHTYLQLYKYRQTGAVLVMALVLLTVLTLIGVTSMSGSSMQMRIASNMQQHNIAFQGAQSRIAYAISTGAATPIDFKANIPANAVPPYWIQDCNPAQGCADGNDWAATASVYYKGCTIALGTSLQVGKGTAVNLFEVQVTATAKQGIARSTQYQGVLGTVKQCSSS